MFAVPEPPKRITFLQIMKRKLQSSEFRTFLAIFLRSEEDTEEAMIKEIMKDFKRHKFHVNMEYYYDYASMVKIVDVSVETVMEHLRKNFRDE